ncbi:MAG TPA: alpha-glucan family phosphorylase [Patescibacteria group bacterium]|nr:alpha-glucan family phosphorylase [Patescibacteria group bacterium]
MSNQPFWFSQPIAYFCAEFGLSSELPTYAGGLGVLAGDFVKEAASQDFPLVAVGLYYHEGYSRRQLNSTPHQKVSPEKFGLNLVVNAKKEPVLVSIPIQDRTVYAQAWCWQEGLISVYLLDSAVAQNTPADQQITNRLYTADKETRIEQEMILGIGGLRLLKTLGINPSLYHLNEGHSAFLVLELVGQIMANQKIDFPQACRLAREQVVFTNHTLLPAGREIYNNDLIAAMLSKYAETLKVPVTEIIPLGLVKDSSLFSMTLFSLQLSTKMNAVSALHDQEAAKVWTNHPLVQITNGIFLPRWDQIQSNDKAQLWPKHQENKKKLLAVIQEKTGVSWDENTLLVGWARRLVPYKRPLAILENIPRLKAIAQKKDQPLRLVFAGLCHGDDPEKENLLHQLQEILSQELAQVAVFLPGYNIQLAQLLTAGCDIWLNTPVVKSEACGTSGMKAALNGELPVSTKDGWVSEVELFGIGWLLDDIDINPSLLNTLEHQVAPMYYEHLKNPLDSLWLKHMQNSRELVINEFDMNRVLREYTEKLYLPVLKSFYRLSEH